MPITVPTPQLRDKDRKMAELILYVVHRSKEDLRLDATKLNKILFYADFTSYARTGRSITGHTYRKLEHGPAPRPLLQIRNTMRHIGDIELRQREYHSRTQDVVVAKRDPDMSVFTAEDKSIVDDVIEKFEEYDAGEISEASHRFVGWKVAKENEDIPYSIAFIKGTQVPQEALDYGRVLAKRLGV